MWVLVCFFTLFISGTVNAGDHKSHVMHYPHKHQSQHIGYKSHGSHTANHEITTGIYQTGPRGGCYTMTANGRKQYVAHSFCK